MENPIYYRRKALDCLLLGEVEESVRNLEQAVAIAPDEDLTFETYRSISDVAKHHSRKGDYDRAINIYSEVIESNREFTHTSFVRYHVVSDAYKERGRTYVEKGEVSLGIDDYDKLFELSLLSQHDPHDHDAVMSYLSKAHAYESIGDYGHAIENYNKFLEMDPTSFDVYCSMGDIYLAWGEFNQAIESYDKATEFAPNFELAYIKKGNAYFHKGEYALAIENYDSAIEVLRANEADPDYPDDGIDCDYFDIHYRRGMAHYNNADYRSALADVGIALHYDAYDVFARILRDAASAHLD